MRHDLRHLIRNARIVDATGAPWFRADLHIGNGRIAGIGPGPAVDLATVVEADDRRLLRDLIDAHCHDALIVLREPKWPEKTMQRVTTGVVGNWSFSLHPAPALLRHQLAEHFGTAGCHRRRGGQGAFGLVDPPSAFANGCRTDRALREDTASRFRVAVLRFAGRRSRYADREHRWSCTG